MSLALAVASAGRRALLGTLVALALGASSAAAAEAGDIAIAGPAKRADADHHDFAIARYEG